MRRGSGIDRPHTLAGGTARWPIGLCALALAACASGQETPRHATATPAAAESPAATVALDPLPTPGVGDAPTATATATTTLPGGPVAEPTVPADTGVVPTAAPPPSEGDSGVV